jgi:hypothetical protein
MAERELVFSPHFVKRSSHPLGAKNTPNRRSVRLERLIKRESEKNGRKLT